VVEEEEQEEQEEEVVVVVVEGRMMRMVATVQREAEANAEALARCRPSL